MMTIDLVQNFGILGLITLRKFMSSYKVLVLGANGMLGKMVGLYLDSVEELDVDIAA